jgi:hypothetical protein
MRITRLIFDFGKRNKRGKGETYTIRNPSKNKLYTKHIQLNSKTF